MLGGDARSPGTAPLALTVIAFFGVTDPILSVWMEASLCPQALSKELRIPPPQQGSAPSPVSSWGPGRGEDLTWEPPESSAPLGVQPQLESE